MTRIIAALTFALCASTAAASPMSDAVSKMHHDSDRVHIHALETIIAERDLASTRIEMSTARARWDAAVRDGNVVDAGAYAVRYHDALAAERSLLVHLTVVRAERDLARADFRRSARDVRRLAAIAKRRAHVAR
jgi:hypothetical protein